MRTLLHSVLLLSLLVTSLVGCAHLPPTSQEIVDPRPPLLSTLDGRWLMEGDVLGEPATYDLVVAPVLAHSFTELYMKDVQTPPQYEARVFIGHDKKSGKVIVHWLDHFGAMSSIPHGTGTLSENTIQFFVPYDRGAFRDTLTYDPDRGTWQFVIEAEQPSGEWVHFARYELHR